MTTSPAFTATATAADEHQTKLPLKEIPGSYGIPFITPISDRLDYFYRQGAYLFFQSRAARLSSTVIRVNAPPGPFLASNHRVVALLDAKSFPVLFDPSKVDKADVLTGTFLPSLSLTGGVRVCAYLDPSDPRHSKLKTLILNLLASRKSAFIPSFLSSYSALFDAMDADLLEHPTSHFDDHNQAAAFDFFCQALYGSSPSATALGSSGPTRAARWLLLQLHPLLTLGLPMAAEDLLLRTFRFPAFLAKRDYKALYEYFSSAAAAVLDEAEAMGLARDDACHNLLFTTIFNAYGGVKLFLPALLKRVAEAGPELHARLVKEIRDAVQVDGRTVTAVGIERMGLVKSVVWEALRMDPPVESQYGRARREVVVESHDARYVVKEGELMLGFQPMATRDERVVERGEEFVADRFVGEEGRRLLKYVVWSNGPETGSSAAGNKQCAGKDLVVLVGRLLLVVLFLRYDTFSAVTAGGKVDVT